MTVTLETNVKSEIEASRQFCRRITRTAAKNFYYGLRLLPEPKRSAMFALYAYMRLVDDIADEEDGRSIDRRADALEAWRARTHAVLAGDAPSDGAGRQMWPALAETVRRCAIPASIFDDVIEGQRQDLRWQPPENFEQLREYCRRVAGVVGVASIYVWGFDGGAETEAMAVDRGVAFQLTNILRDLREDAARGRVYLPRHELAAANLTEEELRTTTGGPKFLDMMRFQIDRAESYYARSADLERRISPDSRPTLRAMTSIYHLLLRKVARRPERVLRERVSLSLPAKLMIGWRAMRAKG